MAVYKQLPKIELKNIRLTFYEKLPDVFTTKEYKKIAENIGIYQRAAERYIKLFCKDLLDHQRGHYSKSKKP